MQFAKIRQIVAEYYTTRLIRHGPVARGVDWNSLESQHLRFKQLLKVCENFETFSINDFGCGYGALVDYLLESGCSFRYTGFDVSADMISTAFARHGDNEDCFFTNVEADLAESDFTVASGVFNVKLDTPVSEWEAYIMDTLQTMDRLSLHGFSFNVLTSYSDREKMQPELYYADPCFFFDHCKKHFSRDVALLHDYGLYECTMLVRKTMR